MFEWSSDMKPNSKKRNNYIIENRCIIEDNPCNIKTKRS